MFFLVLKNIFIDVSERKERERDGVLALYLPTGPLKPSLDWI